MVPSDPALRPVVTGTRSAIELIQRELPGVGSYPALDQDGDIEYLYREGVRVEKMRPSLSTRIANDRT